MVQPLTPPSNGFVKGARKVYNPLGFQKGYNFVLWFIFAGALFGFILARFMYLNIPGVLCGSVNGPNHAAPGECYYYETFDRYKIGIRLHLYTILPAGFLVVFQFTPVIRHKLIMFHRINGYLIILLSLVSNAGALMIARPAFGGTLSTQAWIGFSAAITTLGLFMAYINIKRLQIDQHRAWMLRTWFYFSTIITLRIINIAAAAIISNLGGYYFAQPCAKIAEIFGGSNGAMLRFYPACSAYASGANPNAYVLVLANMKSGNPVELTTALNVGFGMAGWLATAIHAIGVEVYLRLTPREADRLRQVSYQRQLEAGMKHPGNAGITAQRIGDANPINFETAVENEKLKKRDPAVRSDSDDTLMVARRDTTTAGVGSKAVDERATVTTTA